MTTNRTTGVDDGMDADFNAVLAARETVPNITDWVITPVAGACYACHDGLSPMNHMEQNGGAIDVNRQFAGATESCATCHGPGNIADVDVAHDLLN